MSLDIKKERQFRLNNIQYFFKIIFQYNIKQGKKNKLEVIFRKMFIYYSQKNKVNIKPIDLITLILYNLLIPISLVPINRGRKVFYKFQIVTKNKRLLYLNQYIYSAINKKKKKKNNHHILLANQLFNIVDTTSSLHKKITSHTKMLKSEIIKRKKKKKKK